MRAIPALPVLGTGAVLIALTLWGPPALRAGEPAQTDWSGGGGLSGPVSDWGARFDASSGVSWLAVPGHLALSSTPLASPVTHLLDDTRVGSFGMDAADVDGDGDMDVVGAADNSGDVCLWLNQGGNPIIWVDQPIDVNYPGATAVCARDIDGDGRMDVVATATTYGRGIAWWRNGGGTPISWTKQVIDSRWRNAFEIAVADVNGDGFQDVLSASYNDSVGVWYSDGATPPAWTRQLVDQSFDGAHSVRAADLDGDGDLDLVGVAALANEVAWWRNEGGSPVVWTKRTIRTGFTGARSVSVGDLDADGDPDIAATCWTSHVAWWRNDGGDPLAWTEQTIDASFSGGHSICLADVDGDGRLDVLAAGYVANIISWWRNGGGSPISWTRHDVAGVAGAITVRAADLDGAGDAEVLGASYDLGEFRWWEATEFLAAGELTSSILDTQGLPSLDQVAWSAVQPPATTLAFRVRSSDDAAEMGDWSEEIASPGSLPAPARRYLQYRATLATADPGRSPLLEEVSFTSSGTGVAPISAGAPAGALADRLVTEPNPFSARATLSFRLESAGRVRLSVFDVTGREVRVLADRALPSGHHDFVWDGRGEGGRDLGPGVYLARLQSDGVEQCRKLVRVR